MPPNLISIFPQDFLHKLINFPKETLANLFKLCQQSAQLFKNNELYALDPLVCENACHIRAFTLWQMVQKYQKNSNWHQWDVLIQAIEELLEKMNTLPPISGHTKQTIEQYLQEHHLFIDLDESFLFDIKFVFLSHVLTLTKKQFPSTSFMLQEKTCLEALNALGLVHNKIKSLVSSAQKELSAMSCHFIQKKSKLCSNKILNQLLVTRYDDHKRSYLPQYATAKVILLSALQDNTPVIIRLSRYVQHHYHDELILGFMPSLDKKEFCFTTQFNDQSQTAIICEGVIDYQHTAEAPSAFLNRLNQHSLMQILLANFAAHPQFSGNLRDTPCIYKEAIQSTDDLKPHIAQEWEEFNQHAYFAQKEGCVLENPGLIFLNHVFCDSVLNYQLHDLSIAKLEEMVLDENEL
ncbi:hypothetical protein [uncultured Legionella sp.]|uniref:hypothetical protein n=1 Tax=uncultured Legionella sp. TaxID=210934 RepID=UPI0026330A04|nr:hypothetical protein [uncultured Legionella sp.]